MHADCGLGMQIVVGVWGIAGCEDGLQCVTAVCSVELVVSGSSVYADCCWVVLDLSCADG